MGRALSRMAARLALALALLLPPVLPATGAQFDQQHTAWTALLKRHVIVTDGGRASRVRYAGFARDRAALKNYLAALSAVSAREFAHWDKASRLAFLLNAYNAHMIELVLTRYPDIRSVQDFGMVFNNPFRRKFFVLLEREASLDMIEHETIRAKGDYDEPRIHFAVNCASVGCPMLREEAYTGDRLEAQLEEQTTRFLSDRTRNRHNIGARTLEVSAIFRWYAEDFTRNGATREDFFARHAALLADDTESRRQIGEKRAPVRTLDYDWRLNDAPP
jgi:hypothetical protein